MDPATEVTGELPIEIGITTRDTNNILSDADGFSEEIVTSGIVNIVDINDLPIITNSSEDSHYFHNNLELHPNIVMEDIDNENFNNGVITVTITPYGESPFELIEGEDEINISTENGISVDADNNVYFEENVIGSIISSARLGDLRISLNENANLDAVQRVMQSLFYVNNSGHEPVEGQRNISMSFQDGSGPNEAGETEVIVDRIVTVFRGASGTTGNDIVSADTENPELKENLVGGSGNDTFVANGGDIINLHFEAKFLELYNPDLSIQSPSVNLGGSAAFADSEGIFAENDVLNKFSFADEFTVSGLSGDTDIIYPYANNGDVIEITSEEIVNSLSNLVPISDLFPDTYLLEEGDIESISSGLYQITQKFNESTGIPEALLVQPLVESDGISDVVGSDQGDTVSANSLDNVIDTRGGSDTIFGADGDDRIYAGAGDDYIHGGRGADIIYGDSNSLNNQGLSTSGNDIIAGGDGDDQIFGETGDDIIFGGAGNDIIQAGSGNDTIYASAGLNIIKKDLEST